MAKTSSRREGKIDRRNGEGEECHTPSCALFLHKVDLPLDPELYTVIDEYEDED